MILVGTDHATYLKYPESEKGRRFIERLEQVANTEPVGVAIVTIEERMRGSSPNASSHPGQYFCSRKVALRVFLKYACAGGAISCNVRSVRMWCRAVRARTCRRGAHDAARI